LPRIPRQGTMLLQLRRIRLTPILRRRRTAGQA
jgi:hypothetical protein